MAPVMTTIINTLIIGSGPAGHTAGLYLARANQHPVMLEGITTDNLVPGGLLMTTKTVENFPGFPDGIDGFDLTERFKAQSTKFGLDIRQEHAISITQYPETHLFTVMTAETTYTARSIIIATGSTPNRLYIPGYDEFWHNGVSTCAVCDGGLPCFRKAVLAVVGGGDSACEEALHLSHTAAKVYLIHRRDSLRASKIMIDRVVNNPKIEIIWNTEVVKINGAEHVESLELRNTNSPADGAAGVSDLAVRGLFVAIGHTPNSKFVQNMVNVDANGYIITDRTQATNVRGIWAVGDVQDPHYRQAITAAASGCVAALEVERWLSTAGSQDTCQ